MAVIPGAIDSASYAAIINTETISTMLRTEQEAPFIADQIAYVMDSSRDSSPTRSLPKEVAAETTTTEAAGLSETDELGYVEDTTTSVEIGHARVGLSKVQSKDALQDAVIEMTARSIAASRRKTRKRMDIDLLLRLVDGTNLQDFSGNPMTFARLVLALNALRTLDAKEGDFVAFVGHSKQIGDLRTDALTTSQQFFDSIFKGQGGSVMSAATPRGFVGIWNGIHIFETNNVPEADASNHNGALITVGDEDTAALGLSIKDPITTTVDYLHRRISYEHTTSVRYGSNVIDDDQMIKVISAK